uniref:Uncharacterized protein n=1 Tax=Lactuca sativa TaxID=4236 RepID=A0A9R1XXS0_LACSA|nr:hypothetical protein LSAT_V11C100001050 [Lactuca sativa]
MRHQTRRVTLADSPSRSLTPQPGSRSDSPSPSLDSPSLPLKLGFSFFSWLSKLWVLQYWKPIVDNFNANLSLWKAKNVYFGGHVTLVRSDLTPKVLRVFWKEFKEGSFWGGVGNTKKIGWCGILWRSWKI